MSENRNPVLDFDWEKDIANAPSPQRYILDLKPAKTDEEWVLSGLTYEPHMLVQADPHDIITVVSRTGEQKHHHAHPILWMRTLDQYIYQYFYLMELQNSYQGNQDWIEITLPDTIVQKLENQKKERISKRKLINADLSYLERVGHNAVLLVEGERFRTPKIGAPLYLNYIYRSLMIPKNKTTLINSLGFDGHKFDAELVGGTIPQFKLEDYYLHEAFSGISLSIEIAAVLLEMSHRLPDDALWKKAFDTFCDKALPSIAKSHLFFTRIAVARIFFQQILLEQTVSSYEWNGKETCDSESEKYWSSITERALHYCGMLNTIPYCIEVPANQIDEAVLHIERLLKSIETPINLPQYIKEPTHGLAVFCNREHEYVLGFLNELKRIDPERKENVVKEDCCKKKEIREFIKVYKKVKEAIQRPIQ